MVPDLAGLTLYLERQLRPQGIMYQKRKPETSVK